MALTSLNSVYLSNSINRFFPMNGKVTVNATLEMVANPYTRSTVVKRDIQRKLIQVRIKSSKGAVEVIPKSCMHLHSHLGNQRPQQQHRQRKLVRGRPPQSHSGGR